jgi:N-acylglucosamine-6-phosphate 2-epimerase
MNSPSPDAHVLDMLKGGLIVSCQARANSPMRALRTIVALAECAELGGAAGVRVDGARNIEAVAKAISLPIVGIHKVVVNGITLITPTLDDLPTLVDAGASVVAIELTRRAHPDEKDYVQVLTQVEQQWANRGLTLMADISSFEEGMAALRCGTDLVGTTLAGFTAYTQPSVLPEIHLVEQLAKNGARVVAEGGYGRPEEARKAIERGAWSVCVGAAITDPTEITRQFARALAGLAQSARKGGSASGKETVRPGFDNGQAKERQRTKKKGE